MTLCADKPRKVFLFGSLRMYLTAALPRSLFCIEKNYRSHTLLGNIAWHVFSFFSVLCKKGFAHFLVSTLKIKIHADR